MTLRAHSVLRAEQARPGEGDEGRRCDELRPTSSLATTVLAAACSGCAARDTDGQPRLPALAYGFPRARWVPAALKMHLQFQLLLARAEGANGGRGQATLAALDLISARPELQVRLLDGDAGADDAEGPLPQPGSRWARRLATAALAIREQAMRLLVPSRTHGNGPPRERLDGGEAEVVADAKVETAWDLLAAGRRLADLSGRDDVVAALLIEQQQLLVRLPTSNKGEAGEELRGHLRGLRSAAVEERGQRDLPLATALHAHLRGLPAAAAYLQALPTAPTPDEALSHALVVGNHGGKEKEHAETAWARQMRSAAWRRDCLTIKAFGGARRSSTLPITATPTGGAAVNTAPGSVDGVSAALDTMQRMAATHRRPALMLDRVDEWMARRVSLEATDEPPPRGRCPPLSLLLPDRQVLSFVKADVSWSPFFSYECFFSTTRMFPVQ